MLNNAHPELSVLPRQCLVLLLELLHVLEGVLELGGGADGACDHLVGRVAAVRAG